MGSSGGNNISGQPGIKLFSLFPAKSKTGEKDVSSQMNPWGRGVGGDNIKCRDFGVFFLQLKQFSIYL